MDKQQETTLKYGDFVIFHGSKQKKNSSEQVTGCLSGLGFSEFRIFFQKINSKWLDDPAPGKPPLPAVSNIKNYRDMVFQIWPKVNYEAHKQFSKVAKQKKTIEEIYDKNFKDTLESKYHKTRSRAEEERQNNPNLMKEMIGIPVTFGTEVQFLHVDSQTFLSAKVSCSENDRSAYKFELSANYNSGMVFRIIPKYKSKSEGEPVTFKDKIVIMNVKLHAYINFSSETPIDLDNQISTSNFKPVYNPCPLRKNDPTTLRYEANLSTSSEMTWRIIFHGKPLKEEDKSVKGCDLVRIKHTETGAFLAAHVSFYGRKIEAFLRTVEGEFTDEINSANTLWEVEPDRNVGKGRRLKLKDDKETPQTYRLRHYLTGKCLTCSEDNINGKPILLVHLEDNPDDKSSLLVFKSFFAKTDSQVNYSVAYSFNLREGKAPLQYSEDITYQYNSGIKTVPEVFVPNKDPEFFTNKYGCVGGKDTTPEHAFMFLPVEMEEKLDVAFANSATQRVSSFRDIIVSGSKQFFTPDAAKKVTETILNLICFVTDIDLIFDTIENPSEYKGLPNPKRQRLLKDFGLIEILTDILYYVFKNNFCSWENPIDSTIKNLLQMCYILIKFTIKEYRPNEIYASQWLDMFISQSILSKDQNDILAEPTLTELIDNNQRILEQKNTKGIITKFVDMLLQNNTSDRFINIIRAIITCNGEAMIKNQADVSRLLLENEQNRKLLVYSMKDENQNIELFVTQLDKWISLTKFLDFVYNEEKASLIDYFISFIHLAADLCLSRNYIAINALETIYTFELCFRIISLQKVTNEVMKLKGAFVRLIHALWIDRSPYQPLRLPNYMVIWDDITPSFAQEITGTISVKDERLEYLKSFVLAYISHLSNQGYSIASEKEKNQLTLVILELIKTLVRFGLYPNLHSLNSFLPSLLTLLNGMNDIMTEEDKKKINIKKKKKTNEKERYQETEENIILMKCKTTICEIMKIVFMIYEDFRMRKFMVEFKSQIENNKATGRRSSLPNPAHFASGSSNAINLKQLSEADSAGIERHINSIEAIVADKNLFIEKFTRFNLTKSLFDLTLYQYSPLVNIAFEILTTNFSKRNLLVESLQKLQIVEDKQSIQSVVNMKSLLDNLTKLVEESENWYGENSELALQKSNTCIDILNKLSSYCDIEEANALAQKQMAFEPELEMMPNESTDIRGDKNEVDILDSYIPKNFQPHAEIQTNLKHLGVYDIVKELLHFEIQTSYSNDGSRELKNRVLFALMKFLTRFVYNHRNNQELLCEDLDHLFIKILDINQNIGAELLLEQLYKNNRALLYDSNQIKKISKILFDLILAGQKQGKKINKTLNVLKTLMKHKTRVLKGNQTLVLKVLGNKEYSSLLINGENKAVLDRYCQLLKQFDEKITRANSEIVVLDNELDYLVSMMNMLSFASEEKNSITESKCQKYFPTKSLFQLYTTSKFCWPVKKAIVFFLYHVYFDVEKEMKEDIKIRCDIMAEIVKEMPIMTEELPDCQLKYSLGVFEMEDIIADAFFSGTLLCLEGTIAKKFFRDRKEYENFPKMIGEYIANIAKHRKNTKEERMQLLEFADQVSKYEPPIGSELTLKLNELFGSQDIEAKKKRNSFLMSRKSSNGFDLNLPLAERLRLRMQNIKANSKFINNSEKEFEHMVHILRNLERYDDGSLASISFDDVIRSLIQIVDIKEMTLTKELTVIGLKIFRKLIEMENPITSLPTIQWESEDWLDYEAKISKTQVELCRLGTVELLANMISFSDDLPLINEALLVSISLLLGGNKTSQSCFIDYFKQDPDNRFFNTLKELIQKNFEIFKKSMSERNKTYLRAIIETGSIDAALQDDEDEDENMILLIRIFRLLQLFCEGHASDMQNYLNRQINANGLQLGKTHNFISSGAMIFFNFVKFCNQDSIKFGKKILDFLIEVVQGPCPLNQVALAKAKIARTCMDFISMFTEQSEYISHGFVTEEQREELNEVKTQTLSLLAAIIEATTNTEIVTEVCAALDYPYLINKMRQDYADFIKLKRGKYFGFFGNSLSAILDKLKKKDFDGKIKESLTIYILLMTLSDQHEETKQILKDTEKLTQEERDSLAFYQANTASIEVFFQDKLLRVYFTIAPVCRYLSRASRKKLMEEVNRDSPNEKIMGLVKESDNLFDEMDHMEWLSERPFAFNSKRMNMLRDFSTFIAFLINILILVTYNTTFVNSKQNVVLEKTFGVLETDQVINVLGYIQLGTVALMLVFWIMTKSILVIKQGWRERIESMKIDIPHDPTDDIEDTTDPSSLSLGETITILKRRGPGANIFNRNGSRSFGHFYTRFVYLWETLAILFRCGSFNYLIFFNILSYLAVFLPNAEWVYSFQLLDIVNRSQNLQNLIRAVTYNWKQLVLTAMFGFAVMFFFSLFAFFYMDSMYTGYPSDENFCTTMLQCYVSTIDGGLRPGEGIGNNIAHESYATTNRERYYYQFFFDMLFFIIINVIFLNIIFGIIIDTFAELRDQRAKIDDDTKNVCFICNLPRDAFDKVPGGFDHHIKAEHNLWNYLYFIHLLKNKDPNDYNGIESYAAEKLEDDDNSWLPLLKAIAVPDVVVENTEEKED